MTHQLEAKCLAFLQQQVCADAAHKLDHILRVVGLATLFCQQEGAKLAVVLPAAYLHDCVTLAKNHPQRANASMLAADKAVAFLTDIDYSADYLADIHHAIVAHSYSGQVKPKTLEAKIVQDADRLDALGAIGISRCIQVGSGLGRDLYHTNDPLCEQRTPNDTLYTIDHFFTKLLLIQDTVHTDAAKKEAKIRSQFMRSFLTQLKSELSF
ncbi:HD domain-containing protein [Agarivorans sp. 1_MG-2023]|uniref:HD domain-containing protein n=1 Tax=Agarivorans sp. 1_MG-2023 TaxID=3062634 RepID=UPI0026E29AD0|nr:HD domain-containing protein [Agarivorans sp. 1_MG-2023]MDO6764709.1 HD domain-containing protein [Agarivorans sp. 1_MG-2023]